VNFDETVARNVEKALADADRLLRDGPDLSEKRVTPLTSVVEAFACGVMRATPGTDEGAFSLPIAFESVVNWVSDFLMRRYRDARICDGDVFLFEASINEVVGVMKEAASEHPAFQRWNNPPDHRPFIDLDAIWQNVVVRMKEHFYVKPW